MKPKVFIVMPFEEMYEIIYKKVLFPTLNKFGYSVIRADEMPQSTVVIADIEKSIKESDLIT